MPQTGTVGEVVRKLQKAAHLDTPIWLEGKEAEDDERLAEQLALAARESRQALLPQRFARMDQNFAFLIRCLTTATTIGEAFRLIADYGATYWSGLADVWTEETESRLALVCEPVGQDRDRLFVHELRCAAVTFAALDWLSGGKVESLKAEFGYMPLAIDELARIFPYQISVGPSLTTLSVSLQDCTKPVVRLPSEVSTFLDRVSTIAVFGHNYRASIGKEVQSLLERGLLLHHRVPSLEETCARLEVSPATLHRRLREKGLSFRELREHTLNTVAKRLLAESSASIATISECLGYSEERPFRRSFLRWNGCSPSAFRGGSAIQNKTPREFTEAKGSSYALG